jgi:hypothetical protein
MKAPTLKGAGTIMYRAQEDYAIVRGHHGAPSRLMNRDFMKKHYEDMRVRYQGPGHSGEFIQSCITGSSTNSPFEVGGHLTQILCLGVICQRLNTDLDFDTSKKQFKGNTLANDLLAPPPRKGWEDFYKMA